MPPKKGKKKNSSTRKALALPGALEEDVAQATTWPLVIEVLCRCLNIPDLSTKRGLKECYKNIDEISSTLNDAFDQSETNPRLRGGIVGIFGKLAYDSVLRNALVRKGFLPRIVTMLNNQDTYLIALQALAVITRHGGLEVRKDVAKLATSDIVKAIREHLTDDASFSTAVTILGHTVSSIYSQEEPIYRQFPSVRMPEILIALHEGLAGTRLHRDIFYHAHEVIASASRHAYSQLERHQPSLDFIVAALRVPDLRSRTATLLALLTFHFHHAEEARHPIDTMRRLRASQNLPSHLQSVILQYGAERSDVYLCLKATTAFQKAQMQAAQTKDLFELGLKLSELVTMTEHSMGEGFFQTDNGRTVDIGLPYTSFMESLPHAAKALRERDPIQYADMADMLDIKFCIVRQQYEKARKLCEAAMPRSKHAFWYYMRATADPEGKKSKLKWAKLGLRCQKTTPYLRFGLLELGVSVAANMGLEDLEGAEEGSDKWFLALAMLHSALEDTLTFIKEAPPDCRGMPDMCVIALMLSLVLKEGVVSPNMSELISLQNKLRIADEFSDLIRNGTILSQWRRAYMTTIERYERVAKIWDPRFEGVFSEEADPPKMKQEEEANGLAEWLETVTLEDGEQVRETGCGHTTKVMAGRSFIDGKTIALYQCSLCGNPSAVLKRCSRCGTTRYCDENCQKEHWKVHKRDCTVKAS